MTRYAWWMLIAACLWGQPSFAQGADQMSQKQQQRIRLEVCLGCHRAQYDAIRNTPHWMSGDARTPVSVHECSTCHGELEEHVLTAGKQGRQDGAQTFGRVTTLSVTEQNAVCLGCHKTSEMIHWAGSGHDLEEIGCVGCHRIHSPDEVVERSSQQQVCFTCHADMRAKSHKPYGHPIREGGMGCTDCHGAHGGPGDAGLKAFSVNEVCYECHAEKRGPFLWEHQPASEDCMLCHDAHGSIHQGMLARREPHLCQSCHEPTALANNPLGPHARHSRLALSFREPGQADQGPDPTPGSRGISRFVLGEACSNCHNQVHGSNHPAGAKLMR